MEKTKMHYTSPESEVLELKLEGCVLTGSQEDVGGEGYGWEN